jgi:hypothetical protein
MDGKMKPVLFSLVLSLMFSGCAATGPRGDEVDQEDHADTVYSDPTYRPGINLGIGLGRWGGRTGGGVGIGLGF